MWSGVCLTAKDLTEDEKRGLSKNVKGVITKGQIDKTALLALTDKLLYAKPQKAAGAELINPPGPQVAGKRKRPARILVVEDRADNLTLIQEILNTKGYTIQRSMLDVRCSMFIFLSPSCY